VGPTSISVVTGDRETRRGILALAGLAKGVTASCRFR